MLSAYGTSGASDNILCFHQECFTRNSASVGGAVPQHWNQPFLDIHPKASYMQSIVFERISSRFTLNKRSVAFSTLSRIWGVL